MITVRRNQGFVLFMTLVMLVILTLSGLAMMQVMSAGMTAAGNIAFRQASVRYADLALEDARVWLQSKNGGTVVYLHEDHPADHGYTSWYDKDFDPKSLDWTDPNVAHLYTANPDPDFDGDGDPTTFSGYRIYYVIHRLAVLRGTSSDPKSCTDPGTGCMFPPTASSSTLAPGTTQSAGTGYTPPILGSTGNVYFRITAKVVGPRHNSSYVQAIMH
jgi:Tfp pilus assembly protein PilX